MRKYLIGLLVLMFAPLALAQVPPEGVNAFEYMRWVEPSSNRYDVACSIDRTGDNPLQIYNIVLRDANYISMLSLAYGIGVIQDAYLEALAQFQGLAPEDQNPEALRSLMAGALAN